MYLSQLTDATLEKVFKVGHPLMLRGPVGIGKTERIETFCENHGLGFVPFPCTSLDAPDMQGFLVPHKGEDGPTAIFTKPNWLQRIEETGKKHGILFMDEFPQSEHLVQKAAAPLLSEGRIGQWRLPRGWRVWLAGNRVKDKAGVNRMLAHVTNRIISLDIEGHVDGWASWAYDHGIHWMYVAFARSKPGVLFNDDEVKDPNAPRCTPRSFSRAAKYHTFGLADGVDLPTDETTLQMLAAYIGEAATGEFMAYTRTKELLPDIDDILRDPMRAKVPPLERMDAQWAAMQLLIHHATKQNIETLFDYAMRLAKEMQVAIVSTLLTTVKGGALLNSPKLTQFIVENEALISSTTETA